MLPCYSWLPRITNHNQHHHSSPSCCVPFSIFCVCKKPPYKLLCKPKINFGNASLPYILIYIPQYVFLVVLFFVFDNDNKKMFLRFGCYPQTKSQSVYGGIGKSLQEEEDDSVILMMMINGFIKCSAVVVGASIHPRSPFIPIHPLGIQ